MTVTFLPIDRRKLLLSTAGLAFASAMGARPSFAQAKKSVAIALPTDPRSLDPLFKDDAVSGSIQRHIFDT
ncbi:hypothetical protein HI113_45910, partial [Corallococcus exiguus]|uniref:hypothetical protein n=1 Tax=Corallococcus exiguus TaxID=83462 RepID=UPI0017E3E463